MPRTSSGPEPVLEMTGIDKAFPGVQALDGAQLSILPGEVHGLVGENGAGKSTIIKILAGVYERDAGSILIGGSPLEDLTSQAVHELGVRFVHQELHLVPHLTVAESVFMGHELSRSGLLRRREMRRRAERFLSERLGAELDGEALIRDLGSAERKLVQVARALVDEGARLVVFDEPTAPLASGEIDRVFAAVERLRDQGVACLYVSHYLAEITRLCDRVTVFRNGTDVGSLAQLDEHSHREMIRLMVGRELGQLFPERSSEPGEVVLAASGLGDDGAFSEVDLEVRRGEIVGVAGILGSGREELIDALAGLRRIRSGRLELVGRRARLRSPADALDRGLALVPRDRRNDGLVLAMSAADNVNLATLSEIARTGWILRDAADQQARRMVDQLDIRPAAVDRPARLFSGGNQQKMVLARWLAADVDVLLFDEPTVGVDIGAKAEIYQRMAEVAERGAGLLVASNDTSELLGICDRIIVMVRGRIAGVVQRGEVELDALIALVTGGDAAGDAVGAGRHAEDAAEIGEQDR